MRSVTFLLLWVFPLLEKWTELTLFMGISHGPCVVTGKLVMISSAGPSTCHSRQRTVHCLHRCPWGVNGTSAQLSPRVSHSNQCSKAPLPSLTLPQMHGMLVQGISCLSLWHLWESSRHAWSWGEFFCFPETGRHQIDLERGSHGRPVSSPPLSILSQQPQNHAFSIKYTFLGL